MTAWWPWPWPALARKVLLSKQDPGHVMFYDIDGTLLSTVEAGALPDMLTFTPDGNGVLVANEGEPNDMYTIDPEGSLSYVDLSGGDNAM